VKGGMMSYPLTVPRLLERAGTLFGAKQVVSYRQDHRTSMGWRDVHRRAAALAAALPALGVRPGDRVATLAWNTHRHLELYFAVPDSGAVLLTVNARLSVSQIAHILRHAGATAIFADPDLADLAEEALQGVPEIAHRVSLSAEPRSGWKTYEELIAAATRETPVRPVPAPDLNENDAAALCYTSGTTGEPKGVLYSHRALALHTLAICLPDGFGLGEPDVILPAVPMFHANAWGLPYAAAMTGATLVLPGPRPSPALLAKIIAEEGVTFAAGVPTVWMAVLEELRSRPRRLAPRLRIHSGGAPTPPALIEAWRNELGVEILTGWGMTELTPVGMVTHPRGDMAEWEPTRLLRVRTSQGTPLPFVDARIVDEGGAPVLPDGTTPGELQVRGPWVTAGYFRDDGRDDFHDGWLRTGDVATVDELGYVRLIDRTKDLIRSGGEWISSVQLEHALMDHPDVAEAVVVSVPDPRWQERPCACVVLRPGVGPAPEELLEPLTSRFPKWWIPDRVVVMDAIPRTSTGKFDKKAVRERLRGVGSDSG